MSLEETRARIDAIDAEIVKLLDRRAEAGRDAARLKNAGRLPLRNPAREKEVLARALGLSNGSMPKKGLENIYRAIISETLAQESRGGGNAARREAGRTIAADRKLDAEAEVVENRRIAAGFHRMRLHAPALGGLFLPGQFFQLRLDAGGGTFLRRPFAPSECGPDGFAFVYSVVGRGTTAMAELEPGARLRVLAPLGNGYALPPAGSSVLLVGGGCGGPSLAPLAANLKRDGVRTTALLGARTADMLLEHELFAKLVDRLILATDDGSHGRKGTALDAFRTEKVGRPDRIYACGPHPMLRAAAKLADELGVICQVSLEERMACGFGACMGCAVPVKAEGGDSVFRRVCHEGPVFDAQTLDWENMR